MHVQGEFGYRRLVGSGKKESPLKMRDAMAATGMIFASRISCFRVNISDHLFWYYLGCIDNVSFFPEYDEDRSHE